MKKHKNFYKTLGPKGAKLISWLNQHRQSVFSIKEAAGILATDTYKIRELLRELVRKGWLQRLEKGKYLTIPLSVDSSQPYTENQFSIASKLISPYYIGFWNMLNYYGYTEQLPNTVFIASLKRKREINITGVTYKFIRISSHKMFGLTEIKINGNSIWVSDREKTIIDCLDHPEYCGGIVEATKGIWNARNEVDFHKIMVYIGKMKNSAIIKRLGYIIELFGLNERIEIKALQQMVSKGYSLLDPKLPKKGRYSSKWKLLINIPKEELLSLTRV